MSLPARPAKPTVVPSRSTGSVFSRLDFPTQRDYHQTSKERGLALTPEQRHISERMRDDSRSMDTSKATVARVRRLQRRLVKDGERTYTAYSADELIEIDSLAHHGRPGMPY